MNGFFGMIGVAAKANQMRADANLKNIQAREYATRAERECNNLEDRLDKLLLACTALWELLRDRTDLTEDDLLAKVQEVDLRDGQADGKITKTVKKCPRCGRTMSPRHGECLYCGERDLSAGVFDAAT
jgi:ribosomal protein S27AE